jgi:MtN3 and saliva related transmembrane protein
MGLRLTHKELKELNKVIMLVAIIEPLTTLPQIIEVFTKQNVSGVSVWTWSLYLLAEVIWLIYGLAIKNRPVIVTNFLWILMDSSVVIGVLINSR